MLIIINIIGHKFSGVNTAYTCVFVCIYKIQMFSVKEGQQWWFQLKAMLFLMWNSEPFRKNRISLIYCFRNSKIETEIHS